MRAVSDEDQIAKANEDINRAALARSVLDNPLVKEYFISAKGALFERLSKSKLKDVQDREQIYLELQQLQRFESNFEKAIANGKLAESWLEKLKRKVRINRN